MDNVEYLAARPTRAPRSMSKSHRDNIIATATAKKAACDSLREVIDSGALSDTYELPAVLIEAIKLAVGYKKKPSTGSTASLLSRVYTYINGRDSVPELELFNVFAVGRSEMKTMKRQFATKLEDDKKLYIMLENDAWRVLGQGPTVPEGFLLN